MRRIVGVLGVGLLIIGLIFLASGPELFDHWYTATRASLRQAPLWSGIQSDGALVAQRVESVWGSGGMMAIGIAACNTANRPTQLSIVANSGASGMSHCSPTQTANAQQTDNSGDQQADDPGNQLSYDQAALAAQIKDLKEKTSQLADWSQQLKIDLANKNSDPKKLHEAVRRIDKLTKQIQKRTAAISRIFSPSRPGGSPSMDSPSNGTPSIYSPLWSISASPSNKPRPTAKRG